MLRSRGAGTRPDRGAGPDRGPCSSRSRPRSWARGSRRPPRGIQRGRTARGHRSVHRPERRPPTRTWLRPRRRCVCLVALTLPGVLAAILPRCPAATRGRAETTGRPAARHRHRIARRSRPRAVAAPPIRRAVDPLHPGHDRHRSAARRGPGDRPAGGRALGAPGPADAPARLERVTSRGRGLVPSLGSRQLARRPLRYTRAALLLMLAMAIGVFAVSYTWTWTASQRDQATFQVGTDLRVEPGRQRGSGRAGAWTALCRVPGVTGPVPVDRESVEPPGVAQAQALALDASAAPALVAPPLGPAAAPVADADGPLAAARPSLEAVRLPGEPRALRLAVRPIRRLDDDPVRREDEDVRFVPAEASEIAGGGGSTYRWWSATRAACSTGSRVSGPRWTAARRDGRPPRTGGECRRGDVRLSAGPARDRAPDRTPSDTRCRTPGSRSATSRASTPPSAAGDGRVAAGPDSRCPTAGGAPSPTSAGRPTVSSRAFAATALVTEVGQPGIPALR